MKDGAARIRQVSSGEVMHPSIEPYEESLQLYVKQSRIAERLLQAESLKPFVLWDVGLGVATNAMAAISSVRQMAMTSVGVCVKLRIFSFENDLDSLRLALEHVADFPHLAESAPRILVETGRWQWQENDVAIEWYLMAGDFLELMKDAPQPDLIYYDPFSARSDGGLWTLSCFRKLYQRCRNHPMHLFTYSGATSVRAAMLAAGFYVCQGQSIGLKKETTIASSIATSDYPLLGDRWLQRWERSDSKYPRDVSMVDLTEFVELINRHPQFVSKS